MAKLKQTIVRKTTLSSGKMDLGIDGIVQTLSAREKAHDEIIIASRGLVRECVLAIKALHAGETDAARAKIKLVESQLSALPKDEESRYLLDPIFQEYVEASLLLAALEGRTLPDARALNVPPEPFLTGLCDVVGEFRRAMLERLKAGDTEAAKYFFGLASGIYEELMPVRFSSSVLPNFRKKQDVARGQVEQARAELLRYIR